MQVAKTHFHRLIVVKSLVGGKKFGAIRTSVPPYTYNITMQGRADFKHLVDGSVVWMRKGTTVPGWRVSPPSGCGKDQIEAG